MIKIFTLLAFLYSLACQQQTDELASTKDNKPTTIGEATQLPVPQINNELTVETVDAIAQRLGTFEVTGVRLDRSSQCILRSRVIPANPSNGLPLMVFVTITLRNGHPIHDIVKTFDFIPGNSEAGEVEDLPSGVATIHGGKSDLSQFYTVLYLDKKISRHR